MYTFTKEKKSVPAIPLAILAGAALGSAIGILFAPGKGSESRKRIKDKANDLKSIFGNSSIGSFNEDQSGGSTSYKNMSDDKAVATMHAPASNASGDSTSSKAAAMVNHLKHTKQETNSVTEPQ